MKKILLVACCWFLVADSFGQTVSQKLQISFQKFTNDAQLKHAISSLYVIEAKTGKVVFDKNSQIGLVPASTLKIITAATAFELLGKDYRYKTEITQFINETPPLMEELNISGNGDPTFGSWRFNSTKPEIILLNISNALKKEGVSRINGPITAYNNNFDPIHIPRGWIWEDIGNYYGAGSCGINWRENQYDLWMKPGKKEGDSVYIITTEPVQDFEIMNNVKTGGKGSGDNAYIFFNPANKMITVNGTIPCCVDKFKISGHDPNPFYSVIGELRNFLQKENITTLNNAKAGTNGAEIKRNKRSLYTYYSPSLDSIIYWFMQKSINLYGEALIKTFAYEIKGFGSTDTGLAIVKKFWKENGIDEGELNIGDGSGLSPQNRMTTHAQVEVLKYVKKQPWFSYFYEALPEYNNMKMKSGTIKGVKGFAGYHTSKSGKEYIFSFLVNNYNGSPSALVNKMYKVLDNLK